MDLLTPRLEQQVSPAPWSVLRSRIDLPSLIRAAIEQQPDASVDEVVAQLARWHVQASGIIVAMWLPRLKTSAVTPGSHRQEGNLVEKVEKNDSSRLQKGESQWTTTL
jgi:hypothetical protein